MKIISLITLTLFLPIFIFSGSSNPKILAIETIIAISKQQIKLGDIASESLVKKSSFSRFHDFINRERVLVCMYGPDNTPLIKFGMIQRFDTPRWNTRPTNLIQVVISENNTVLKEKKDIGKILSNVFPLSELAVHGLVNSLTNHEQLTSLQQALPIELFERLEDRYNALNTNSDLIIKKIT